MLKRGAKLPTLALLTLLLSGCSSLAPQPQPDTPTAADSRCATLLAQTRQRIDAAGTRDPLGYPIEAYPYLRVNRLLASFSGQLGAQFNTRFSAQVDGSTRFEYWYQQLYRLGRQAREIELANLNPPLDRASSAQIERCIEVQARRDRQADGFRQRLTAGAQVPELYSSWQRALGLFPLTRQIVLQQIDKQQRVWRQQFNSPALLSGASRHYLPPVSAPLTSAEIADWLQQARSANPLGIPQLPPSRERRLFRHFAPAWQLFQRSGSDLIGSLYWHDNRPRLNSSDPVSYLLPSYTRFNGELLLQLNYLVWFSERPAQQPLDLYSGLLDGLLWRVTLASDGQVLLYDSIHPCGCYHQLFPVSERLRLKPPVAGVEAPLILTGVAPGRSPGRLVLQLTAHDHYLQGIGRLQPAIETGTRYRLASYHRLRSLPAAGGRRNLFAADGLVRGSERLESVWLWPMGVASPGAMRVWGRHAISFANRRYFDQPDLLEQFFSPTPD